MRISLPVAARATALGCLAGLAAPTPISAQMPTFTLFGSGCPNGGTAQPVALHNNGLPALGFPLQIEITQAPPLSFAVLMLAVAQIPPIDLGFLGAPGCLLYMLPDATVGVGCDASGTGAVTFGVPNNPGLAGASLHTQWVDVALPSLQLSTSNGGTAHIEAQPAGIRTPSVQAPASGQVGTQIVVRVRDLGTTNPDDVCLRLMDPTTNGLSLLRVMSITFDNSTQEDVLTTQLVTVATRGGPVQAQIGMMRGGGAQPSTSATACLNTPVSAWAWQGVSLPGNDITIPTSFMAIPSANRLTTSFVYDSGSNSMYVDVPDYPFGNGGLYPPASGITTDAHGDTQCGGVPNAHFDHFLETATVKAGCNLSKQTVAIEHAPQLQQAFDNVFGAGRLTITAETSATQARIRIKPTNPSCTLLGGGGSFVVTQ